MDENELLQWSIGFFNSELAAIRDRLTEIQWCGDWNNEELMDLAQQQQLLIEVLLSLLKEYVKGKPEKREVLERRIFERQLALLLGQNHIGIT